MDELEQKGTKGMKRPKFQQITLKVLRWEERDKRMIIKEAERLPERGLGAVAGAGRSPAPLPPLTLFNILITVQTETWLPNASSVLHRWLIKKRKCALTFKL